MKPIVTLLKLLWSAVVIAIPLVGFWVASSLAAYLNGPRWAAILVGGLLFPILPLAWELKARGLRPTKQRFLTRSDRLIIRTFAINLLFVGGLLYFKPASVFTALSARGDWPLDDQRSAFAQAVRPYIFKTADQLEWVYLAAYQNRYGSDERPPQPQPDPGPVPTPGGDLIALAPEQGADAGVSSTDSGVAPDGGAPDGGTPDAGSVAPEKPKEPERTKSVNWPMSSTAHPAAQALLKNEASSLEQAALQIAEREKDPYQRVKAIHDYIALRTFYDDVALAKGLYPPQDAKTVFAQKKGVCAGYAKLFIEMTKAVGLKSSYVVGAIRDKNASVTGSEHAWNAVQIEGRWFLVDVTWDSPNKLSQKKLSQKAPKRGLSADYLLTPPEVFGLDHFPDEKRWQLLDTPISRGEFIRQPMVSSSFHRQDLQLINPKRSQVSVTGRFELEVENPQRKYLLATYQPKGSAEASKTKCKPKGQPATHAARAKLACDLPKEGVYQVLLFTNQNPYGTFSYVGQFEVANRL